MSKKSYSSRKLGDIRGHFSSSRKKSLRSSSNISHEEAVSGQTKGLEEMFKRLQAD